MMLWCVQNRNSLKLFHYAPLIVFVSWPPILASGLPPRDEVAVLTAQLASYRLWWLRGYLPPLSSVPVHSEYLRLPLDEPCYCLGSLNKDRPLPGASRECWHCILLIYSYSYIQEVSIFTSSVGIDLSIRDPRIVPWKKPDTTTPSATNSGRHIDFDMNLIMMQYLGFSRDAAQITSLP